jgi:hypothetical protein
MRYLLILALCLPCFAQLGPQPRTIDKPFVALNASYYAAGLLDVAITQDCIRAGTCAEANMLMPTSAWGQFGVVTGATALTTFSSYELKKHGHTRLWWVPPVIGIVAHTYGGATGVRYFQWRFVLP